MNRILLILLLVSSSLSAVWSQSGGSFKQEEIIYGHKDGMALTFFVTSPTLKNNNRAILWLASGGYYSEQKWIPELNNKAKEFLDRGYTVFFILHSSAPMYTSVDAIGDVQRAIQYIRNKAADFDISPDHIGITGSSSGGNLSLIAANTDIADPSSPVPLERTSSRIQAVACFYPPTDFLNYRRPGNMTFKDSTIMKMVREAWIASAFKFKELNPKDNTFSFIKDEHKLEALYKKLSPIYNVDSNSPPTLIYHGDNDSLVPIYQSEIFIDKLNSNKIAAKLVVMQGHGHGWSDQTPEIRAFADWFDLYLK